MTSTAQQRIASVEFHPVLDVAYQTKGFRQVVAPGKLVVKMLRVEGSGIVSYTDPQECDGLVEGFLHTTEGVSVETMHKAAYSFSRRQFDAAEGAVFLATFRAWLATEGAGNWRKVWLTNVLSYAE